MSEYRLAKSYEESGYEIIEESVHEENGKLYASARCTCFRCAGKGRINCYAHIDQGICFACAGKGFFYKDHCRAYTDTEREKLDEQAARKRQRDLEKKRAEAGAKRQAWLEKYNIEDGDIFIVAGCNTFGIKDELKELGAKFFTGLGWFFGKKNVPDTLPDKKAFLYHTTVEETLFWNELGGGPYFVDGAVEAIKQGIWKMGAELNKTSSHSVHVGEIKERLRDMHGTFVSAKYFENEWGGKYIYTFDIDGNIFTWFSQSILDNDINPGDAIVLTGTVKDHTEFNGILQTVLSRCIVKKGE